MSDFERKTKYVVLSVTDLDSLSPTDQLIAGALFSKLEKIREARGKDPVIDAVVVKSTWSCYNKVWDLVEEELAGE